MYELHPPHVHQVSRTNPSTRPGLDLCRPSATPPGSIPYMCTPPEFYSCPILSDVVTFCQILFPSKPVVRAIEVSHAACKDEFRENPRSYSCRLLMFLTLLFLSVRYIDMYSVHACDARVVFLEHGALDICKSSVCT